MLALMATLLCVGVWIAELRLPTRMSGLGATAPRVRRKVYAPDHAIRSFANHVDAVGTRRICQRAGGTIKTCTAPFAASEAKRCAASKKRQDGRLTSCSHLRLRICVLVRSWLRSKGGECER